MLKKVFIITSVIIVCVSSLLIVSMFFLLQSPYSGKVVNAILDQLSPYTIKVQHAAYSPPYQLTLTDVDITDGSQDLHIPKLSLWLSSSLWKDNKLSLDSILIEEANLTLSALNSPLLQSFNTQQLALQNVDIQAPNWSARDVNLQIQKPEWLSPKQTAPYGKVQLSAQQLYVDGEALDKLLIDAQYQAQDSTIYGASFKWRGADVSGQAEQYPQGWSLINVTVNKLKLSKALPVEKLFNGFQDLALPVYHINSLDILNSDISYGNWNLNQIDASLENFFTNQALKQQEQASLSFNAESIDYEQLRLISPTARLNMSNSAISLDEFDADFKQGRIQMSGSLTQKQVNLNWLKVSGVKWLEDTNQLVVILDKASSFLDTLTIKTLEVKNSQLIQVEQRPYWQVSGINIDGKDLQLIQNGEPSLYSGSVEASANNASLDNLLTTQAIVKLTAKNENISIDRAFLPLARGYIEASGQWQRQELSAPWQLSLNIDGFPVDLPLLQAKLPFQVIGIAEADISLEGLSGDYPIFAHSLTGSANLHLHQAALRVQSDDKTTAYQREWPLNTIKIAIDRGRMQISAKGEKAQLAGNIDLAKYQFGTLIFTSEAECKRLWSDILSQTNIVQEVCSPESNRQAVSSVEGAPSTDL